MSGADCHRSLRSQLEQLARSSGSPQWLRRAKAPSGAEVRAAAVLMLFSRGEPPRTPAGQDELPRLAGLGIDDLDIVLLQRASVLRHHPGQVAFPGGSRDPEDDSMTAAALREAEEEAGIAPAGVEVFGEMEPLYIPVSSFLVTPVVGYWSQPGTVQVMDHNESYAVHRISIADLVAPGNRGTFSRPDLGLTTPAFDVGVFKVWGFTAGILDFALEHLGWARDWDRDSSIDIDF
ncbi:NUDIX domain-containing protein [Brevibacterium sanguinis]|uniref:NUDIX domain-containing protein n=2 Tax=Brevibacterium TaxID=1696 RepID=A0A366IGS1_9MICO|nr:MULTISPECIES: CoA pyrophosphatase [Brevibacterium]RBP63402.1 NUDIX domain-containing protein [Brevibacterium sanguinis]RBP69869.1 NUDIX domain-containing protein [Brevibacterium celere]